MAMTLAWGAAVAQKPKAKLKVQFKYQMVSEGGTNAAAVAWSGKDSKYVTVIAGNETFPCEVFSAKGKPIAQGEAGYDWRGLWYNPGTGGFEGNGAGEMGWAGLAFDSEWHPSEVSNINEGQLQPDFQSVGALDYIKNEVVFLGWEDGMLEIYNRNDPDDVHELELDWTGIDIADINATTVGFTGVAGYEYVLLDFTNGNLLFFNREGKNTASSKLPANSPKNDMFAFSFSNGMAFLYDKDARIWYAHKVF